MTFERELFGAGVVDCVRGIYGSGEIPLHRPAFEGRERQYLVECIDSNFVSSVGPRVSEFEGSVASFVGSRFGVATVNGTAALHIALKLVGVERDDEVISQALTFVATCNALAYAGAHPVFVDVDRDTMGMSPVALREFLEKHAIRRGGRSYNRVTGRRFSACVPMHTFGFPLRIREIAGICRDYGIELIEDAAESLGSYSNDTHTGRLGRAATLSFNGNKVITTGGGGMIVTDDEEIARRAKHLTTTAKIPHPYEFVHDEIGFNYRLPNLNAALGCAQMEKLELMLAIKREVASRYRSFFSGTGVRFVEAQGNDVANHWLNAIVLDDQTERDELLQFTNSRGVMTRPIWRLMCKLPMFQHCQSDGLENSRWLEARVINLPSSVPDDQLSRLKQ